MQVQTSDIKIECFKSSGPGGQHKNKRFTAVRAVHLPTGITAIATEYRSQRQNKERALKRLRQKVTQRFKKKKKRIPLKPSRAHQERRLEHKRRRSEKKAARRPVRLESE